MTEISTGDNFENITDMSSDLDISSGDNEMVMAMASMQNIGQALADSDLYPEGEYKLHTFPGMFEIVCIKHSKSDFTFVTRVYDHVIQEFNKTLETKRQFVRDATTEDRPIYEVPIWVIFELAMNLGVHPAFDEKKFEQALWDHFPYLWLDESKAPKRIIT